MATTKFYTDPSSNARETFVVGTQSATLTASGTNTLAITMPIFIRNQKLSYIRVRTIGASAANVTGGALVFTFVGPSDTTQGVSGPTGTGAAVATNTITVTLSNTTGSYADGVFTTTLTAPYPGGTQTATIDVAVASNTAPTCNYVGTGTASAQLIGTFAIDFEVSEEWVA